MSIGVAFSPSGVVALYFHIVNAAWAARRRRRVAPKMHSELDEVRGAIDGRAGRRAFGVTSFGTAKLKQKFLTAVATCRG